MSDVFSRGFSRIARCSVISLVISDPRRVFRAARELAAWLGEVLDAPEHNRLSEFLADDALKVG
jgi:hypothetical protein